MNYTENQTKAIKHLNEYVESGDFWCEAETPEEATNYAWMSDILEILLANGWTQKTAEGTIGSLFEKKIIWDYEMMRGIDTPTGNDQMLHIVTWTNLAA